MRHRIASAVREAVRRYFVAGILFFAPIGVTIWAIASIIIWLDNMLLPRLIKLAMPDLEEPPPRHESSAEIPAEQILSDRCWANKSQQHDGLDQ